MLTYFTKMPFYEYFCLCTDTKFSLEKQFYASDLIVVVDMDSLCAFVFICMHH